MEALNNRISIYLADRLLGDREDMLLHTKVRYCLELILDELEKTVILALIFFSIGYGVEFILCMLTVNITRVDVDFSFTGRGNMYCAS